MNHLTQGRVVDERPRSDRALRAQRATVTGRNSRLRI